MNRFNTAKAALAGTIAVSLSIAIPSALSATSPSQNQAAYRPIQSISYAVGSKAISGYFVEQASTCRVTLMISETGDPEQLLPLSAARVRLELYPGQMAGLDSEEGRSLNFTCGDKAAMLIVDEGERDRIVELQANTVSHEVTASEK